MDMKKIVMAATLLSIVTGGEVSALAAKTTHQSVAKITHVKVTKHKVTGYTTAKSHITLMKLKHGEKASATANKKGKFTVKVKKNNLSKLKFKIKATKAGLKARTYTHKVKKAVQAIDDGVITETPASTTPAPAKPDEGKKPAKDKEKPHETPSSYPVYVTPKDEFLRAQLAFDDAIGLDHPKTNESEDATKNRQNTRAAYLAFINGQISTAGKKDPTKETLASPSGAQNNLETKYAAQRTAINGKSANSYKQILKAAKDLNNASKKISDLNDLLATNQELPQNP